MKRDLVGVEGEWRTRVSDTMEWRRGGGGDGEGADGKWRRGWRRVVETGGGGGGDGGVEKRADAMEWMVEGQEDDREGRTV